MRARDCRERPLSIRGPSSYSKMEVGGQSAKIPEDAIKTATATIKVLGANGTDLGYAHKVPFNYAWDIVVVNGPATYVAP